MADVIITVPGPLLPLSPAGTFHAVVKDHSGTIVFEDDVTNAPFTVTGLTPGNYILHTTYGSHTNGWCFNVSDCECPVVTSATITNPTAGLYYLNIVFDITDVVPSESCPFVIYYDDGFRRTPLIITNNTQFTTVVGDTATKKILLSSPHCSATIKDGMGCTCFTASLVYSCTAPTIPTVVTPQIVNISGSWYLRLSFPDCGGSCHTITFNYVQVNVRPGYSPDAGVVTRTIACIGSFPFVHDFPLSPSPTASLTGIESYVVSFTDCCGTVVNGGPYNSLPSS